MGWTYNWNSKDSENKLINIESESLILVFKRVYRRLESLYLHMMRSKKMMLFSIAYAIFAIIMTLSQWEGDPASGNAICRITRDAIATFGLLGFGASLFKDAQVLQVDGVLLGTLIKYWNPYAVLYMLLQIIYILFGIVASYGTNPIPALICMFGVLAYLASNAIIILSFITPYGNITWRIMEYAKDQLNDRGKETVEKTELRCSIASSIANKYKDHSLKMNGYPNHLFDKNDKDLNYFNIVIDNVNYETDETDGTHYELIVRIYVRIWDAILASSHAHGTSPMSMHGLSSWIMYGIGLNSESEEDNHAQKKKAVMFLGAWIYNVYVLQLRKVMVSIIEASEEEKENATKEFKRILKDRLGFLSEYMDVIFSYNELYHDTEMRIAAAKNGHDNGSETDGKPDELRDVNICGWIIITVICIYKTMDHYNKIPEFQKEEYERGIESFVNRNSSYLKLFIRNTDSNLASTVKWAVVVSGILENIAGMFPYEERPKIDDRFTLADKSERYLKQLLK